MLGSIEYRMDHCVLCGENANGFFVLLDDREEARACISCIIEHYGPGLIRAKNGEEIETIFNCIIFPYAWPDTCDLITAEGLAFKGRPVEQTWYGIRELLRRRRLKLPIICAVRREEDDDVGDAELEYDIYLFCEDQDEVCWWAGSHEQTLAYALGAKWILSNVKNAARHSLFKPGDSVELIADIEEQHQCRIDCSVNGERVFSTRMLLTYIDHLASLFQAESYVRGAADILQHAFKIPSRMVVEKDGDILIRIA